jgi:hypothetical protein
LNQLGWCVQWSYILGYSVVVILTKRNIQLELIVRRQRDGFVCKSCCHAAPDTFLVFRTGHPLTKTVLKSKNMRGLVKSFETYTILLIVRTTSKQESKQYFRMTIKLAGISLPLFRQACERHSSLTIYTRAGYGHF